MLPPPTDAQTRTESRSGEETGKEKSGCFKLFTVVQTRRWSWSRLAGSRAEAPGSARRGAPGRRAPARCGPSRGSHRRDAYFSQSRCRRGDPAPAKEAPDPRSAEAFASDARRAAASLSPRPATVTPNFGQRRPGSVPGTSQVRSGRRSCRRLPPHAPGYLQPRAPGAKSGTESWIAAALGRTLSAPAAAAGSPRPGRQEPCPLLPGRALAGFPVLGSRLSPASGVHGHRPSGVSCCSISLAPASPGAPAPSGTRSRALPRASPW